MGVSAPVKATSSFLEGSWAGGDPSEDLPFVGAIYGPAEPVGLDVEEGDFPGIRLIPLQPPGSGQTQGLQEPDRIWIESLDETSQVRNPNDVKPGAGGDPGLEG